MSVVIPFWNKVALTLRAVRSALDQTHRQVEVVLVDDGSTEDIAPPAALAEIEPRLRLLRQANAGLGAARNQALYVVRGDYIAFLDSDDRFMPHKIERQLDRMQQNGAVFSHTSYYIDYPGGAHGLGLLRSGEFGGACYPRIIGMCPIARPTVMLHRSLVDEGFTFSVDPRTGEDVLTWIDLAMRFTLLGIDEPLSIVVWSDGSAALNLAKKASGLFSIVEALERHPIHRCHSGEIEKLRQSIQAIARDWVAAGRQIEAVRTEYKLVETAFPANLAFPAEGNGSVPPAQGRDA